MEENINSNIRLIDICIRETSIKIHSKELKNAQMEVGVATKISKIKENEDKSKIVEVRLFEEITITNTSNSKDLIEIKVDISGMFLSKLSDNEKIIEEIKKYGFPRLSQQVMAYVTSITSQSGIKPIIIPDIDFSNYFNKTELKMD